MVASASDGIAFGNGIHPSTAFPRFESYRTVRPVEQGSALILKFPENREFNREFFRFSIDSTRPGANSRSNFMRCRKIPCYPRTRTIVLQFQCVAERIP
jgi:hypothetical protein